MSTPHRPVARALRLPAAYAHVPRYLTHHDPELRLRRSVERRALYILERRCRRRPAVNTGLRDRSDMHVQARDGYIHIATVHPNYLNKPWNIIRALQEEGADLFARSANEIADELQYEATWAIETRRRRRLGLYRDIAKDAYDVLSRTGNADGTDRTRLSNPGLTAPSQ